MEQYMHEIELYVQKMMMLPTEGSAIVTKKVKAEKLKKVSICSLNF